MGLYRIDQNSNTLIDLSISGNEASILNGDAVTGQYVSGATETNGEISLTRAALPAGPIGGSGTVSGAADTTFTNLANDDIIQQKGGTLVNRTPAELSVDLLSSIGNGILTNTNGVWGITSLPDPPLSGVNPNDTNFRIPVRNTAGGFDDSSLLERMDQLQSFDATIHHDQGGRDFNIYPTGILADFVTNPTNYDFSVVTSSTTNGREGFTEEIFNSDITRINTQVQIVNVAAAVAFTQAQIITIRIGTSVPVATGVANISGLQSWSTGTSNVLFTFDTVANAQLAVAAFSQTQARLTVTSTVTTIPVAAYNANGEGMLGAFLDGRLAEGDRVRFSQRAGTTELLRHLNSDADIVNIDNHLIVDGPTTLNGTVNFGGRVTVPEPTDRADIARYEDTWLAAIESSGFPQVGSITIDVGGQEDVEVIQIIAVEGAGGEDTWYAYLGVEINTAGTGFGIAFESVVYSTHATNPFAEGTSADNAPINILGTSDNDFIRDITVRGSINLANANAIAYIAIQFGASTPTDITSTVTTTATDTIYLEYTSQYAGSTTTIVDAINTTTGATVTYRNFNLTTGTGIVIPQS